MGARARKIAPRAPPARVCGIQCLPGREGAGRLRSTAETETEWRPESAPRGVVASRFVLSSFLRGLALPPSTSGHAAAQHPAEGS